MKHSPAGIPFDVTTVGCHAIFVTPDTGMVDHMPPV
jgi:hypothetical protein